ncbi:hypothetical protein [Caballeronia sp. LZ019]|uniref:hypothetical protein n=1 Tax=Caballeronia sp. LZ019 TaxID=3038555 RepID=UPI0028548062|nr:hypothetical protein [Caballeronia sp. LZ019]MDR5809079.1 hypothetical protein [Caballeronia sp. LZ019]
MNQPHAPPTTVLLIHGTFAFKEAIEGTTWWQRNSDFHTAFGKMLGSLHEVQPVTRVFTWSGLNSERERRKAARRLADIIIEFERDGARYSLIGHSHGGSVLFDALVLAHLARPGLPGLKRWVTVGTPFLRYGPDGSLLRWMAVLFVELASAIALLPLFNSVIVPLWHEFTLNPQLRETISLLISLFVLVGLLAFGCQRLVAVAISQTREIALIRQRKDVFRALQPRYTCFYSSEDEAINGLASTRAFEGRLMMRAQGWWAAPYNFIIAPLGDQFIWSQLSRRSQGNDLGGLRLREVLTAPDEVAPDGSLPRSVSDQITKRANERLARVAARLRLALYGIAFQGSSVDSLRNTAQHANAVESLVHTSYFLDADVRVALRDALTGATLPAVRGPAATVTLRRKFWPLSLVSTVLLCVAAGLASVELRALLGATQPRSIVSNALVRAPFIGATFEDPEIPYQLITELALRGDIASARLLTSQLQLADDRKIAEASLISGLAIGGRVIEAQRAVTTVAVEQNTKPALALGVLGPESPGPSRGDIAMARALGTAGMTEAARQLLDRFGDEAGEQHTLAAAVMFGLVATHRIDDAVAWFNETAVAARGDMPLPQLMADTCRTNVVEPVAVTAEARGALLVQRVACQEDVNLPAGLRAIRDATARVQAACGVARLLAARDRQSEAILLLRAEHAAFPGFPRVPSEGLAIHHVRYARAFIDIGAPDEARPIMQSIETMQPERYTVGNIVQTADDNSARERALAWASLGNTEAAIRWWSKLPEAMDSLNDKLLLLTNVRTGLVNAGVPATPPRALLYLNHPEDAGRWERITAVFISLGEFDAEKASLSASQRFARLCEIDKRAALIDDPAQQSRARALVAERLIDAGMLRAGLAIAAQCRPVDHVEIVRMAASRFL